MALAGLVLVVVAGLSSQMPVAARTLQLARVGPDSLVGYHHLNDVSATSPAHAFAVGSYGLLNRGRVKTWDGQTWTIAQTSAGVDSELRGVDALSGSDAWAVGSYTDKDAGTGTHALTMHWDGLRWRVVRGPQPSEQRHLSAVSMVSRNDVWAVGTTNNVPYEGDSQTLVKHWDGSSWQVVPSPNPSDTFNVLYDVSVVSATDVWAVGETSVTGVHLLVEHWNGRRWAVVAAPDAHLDSISAVSGNDVWAVGSAYQDGQLQTVTEHWDGQAWTVVPSPSPPSHYGDTLTSVSAVSSDDVWAVGSGRNALYHPGFTIIEHWNGQAWRVVDSPSPGTGVNGLVGVSADSHTDAWAVGSYNDSGSQDRTQNLLLHWDGVRWRQYPNRPPRLRS